MNRRITVLYEGITSSDGRYIQPGAITWREPLPVTVYDEGIPLVIGTATDVQRGDDGGISVVVTIDNGADVEPRSVSAFIDQMKSGIDEGHLSIRSARLASVALMPMLNWPWPEHPQEKP